MLMSHNKTLTTLCALRNIETSITLSCKFLIQVCLKLIFIIISNNVLVLRTFPFVLLSL